jgi:hypothetical protein
MGIKLDKLDEAITLRNHRRNAATIRDAVPYGTINVEITYGGRHDPFSFIETKPIREALHKALSDFITEKDRELAALGVDTEEDKP